MRRFVHNKWYHTAGHSTSSHVPSPPAANEHLAVEAETHACHVQPELSAEAAANEAASKAAFGIGTCSTERLHESESWKVLARYQEVVASAFFIALQAYIFFKYLYPLLMLWASRQELKPYFTLTQ